MRFVFRFVNHTLAVIYMAHLESAWLPSTRDAHFIHAMGTIKVKRGAARAWNIDCKSRPS